MRHYLAIGIEQVELETGVDHHDVVKQVSEIVMTDLAILDQDMLLDDIACEVVVELLGYFLLVHRRGVQCHRQKHGPDQAEQEEQHQHQLGVKTVQHLSRRAVRESGSRRPRRSRCTGANRVRFPFSCAGD